MPVPPTGCLPNPARPAAVGPASPGATAGYDPHPVARDPAQILDRLDAAVSAVAAGLSAAARDPVDRWRNDIGALRFRLRHPPTNRRVVTVVLGGTGTGKSTLVNRLVGATVTAASFRRTFTTGPVAVVDAGRDLPAGWLGVPHVAGGNNGSPPRGKTGELIVVPSGGQPSAPSPIVDTPDLDGDQPANHAQADRAFRWADRAVFVVTPEKYQMTELLPYYRLAARYRLPTVFVMNKAEDPAPPADFARQLHDRDWPDAAVYVVPRNEAAYDPPAPANLDALRTALREPVPPPDPAGLANRTADAVGRLGDQVVGPLRANRAAADRLCGALRAMETPPAGVDVNPITQSLQRRMQQRSVLYLVGPGRVLDRVRQVPTLLARLPRASWDWVMRGNAPADLIDPAERAKAGELPDFAATLAEQFMVLRSRVDDVIRSDPAAAAWVVADADAYAASLMPSSAAAAIAAEEVGKLRAWLEQRWNATPRDTKILQTFIKHLPGGKQLTKWSEAAPYLVTIGLVAHHVLLPHLSLAIGGYTLATWLTERLSNEVTGRTRATNRAIGDRFAQLAHEQLTAACGWLDRQAPPASAMDELERLAGELATEV